MRSKRLKLMVGAVLVAMIGTIFTGCGSDKTSKGENSSSVTISISGSTSVGPLMEKVQEIYEEENSGWLSHYKGCRNISCKKMKKTS